MKNNVQEDFTKRVRINRQEVFARLNTKYRNPDQFSNSDHLNHSEGPLENTRKNEIVVWVLVVAQMVLIVTAFYLLWIKAGVR